jgi:hypothetical protein
MTSGPRPTLCGLVLPRAALWAATARSFWHWRLRHSEIRSEYRFTNTQKRIFHTCVYYGAYPWNGIFGEGSISHVVTRADPLSLASASASAAGRETQGVVWSFNKRSICAAFFVFGAAIREAPESTQISMMIVRSRRAVIIEGKVSRDKLLS